MNLKSNMQTKVRGGVYICLPFLMLGFRIQTSQSVNLPLRSHLGRSSSTISRDVAHPRPGMPSTRLTSVPEPTEWLLPEFTIKHFEEISKKILKGPPVVNSWDFTLFQLESTIL